jgi:hypothetical protein
MTPYRISLDVSIEQNKKMQQTKENNLNIAVGDLRQVGGFL